VYPFLYKLNSPHKICLNPSDAKDHPDTDHKLLLFFAQKKVHYFTKIECNCTVFCA
jgi:hypothetical protein